VTERFLTAEAQDGGDRWVSKVQRGENVSIAERNAFVGQAAGLMDALAAPGRILTPSGIVPPTTLYTGSVAAWNGRQVPVLGGVQPPSDWLVKPAPGARNASGTGADKPWDIQRLLEPTMAERRRYWLALHGSLKAMNGSYQIVEANPQRSAGVLPVAAVVVIAVAAIAALAGIVGYVAGTAIHENAETARNAADLEEAAREHVRRIQWAAEHPDQPMPPPGPAELRVQQPRPSAPAGTPSPLDQAVNNALRESAGLITKVALAAGGIFLAATVLPPVIANLADRATRERHA
jgi:type II secretory pathway pseudopilin PulG